MNGIDTFRKFMNGNKGSKRFIATWGAITGYLLAILVVTYGLSHTISSPSVVTDITISIVGAPFLALVATVFEKPKKGTDHE